MSYRGRLRVKYCLGSPKVKKLFYSYITITRGRELDTVWVEWRYGYLGACVIEGH